jgi:hypothetical protein
MRFEYDGCTYFLEFKRFYRDLTRYRETVQVNEVTGEEMRAIEGFMVKSTHPYTTVRIMKDIPSCVPDILFRSATVGCHPNDHFTVEEGRLRALRKISTGNGLPPGFKREMWAAYFGRTQKAKPTPKSEVHEGIKVG